MSFTSRIKQIEDLITKYRIAPTLVDENEKDVPPPPETDVVVLVTGTTGSLGSYLLSFLLNSPNVSKVYALNRMGKTTLKARQSQAFLDKGLNPLQLEDDRLTLLVGDLEMDQFSLEPGVYDKIKSTITLIIHNAWPVNFIQPIHRFESNINGSCKLIQFALSSPNAAFIRFLFASSISTVVVWKKKTAVPEQVIHDTRCTLGFGYAEAKYVVDRVLEETSLNSSSLRIGQLCGSKQNGAWPIEEWLPLVVKTSMTLRMFPSQLGCVSWLAVDMVAKCIVDIGLSSQKERYPSMFNITSLLPIQCDRAFELIGDALLREGFIDAPIKLVTSDIWLEQIVKHAESSRSHAHDTIPSIKLLKPMQMIHLASQAVTQNIPYNQYSKREFALFGPFETGNAKIWSESFRETKVLDERDAVGWVRYWKGRGFIKPMVVMNSARL